MFCLLVLCCQDFDLKESFYKVPFMPSPYQCKLIRLGIVNLFTLTHSIYSCYFISVFATGSANSFYLIQTCLLNHGHLFFLFQKPSFAAPSNPIVSNFWPLWLQTFIWSKTRQYLHTHKNPRFRCRYSPSLCLLFLYHTVKEVRQKFEMIICLVPISCNFLVACYQLVYLINPWAYWDTLPSLDSSVC